MGHAHNDMARRPAPLIVMRRSDYRRVELCNQLGEYVYVVTQNQNNEPELPRDHANDGHNGMSMRDYFAAAALQGLLTCPVQPQSGPDMYARDAYTLADAMMQARSQ